MIEQRPRPMSEQQESLQVWRCPKCGRILAKLRLGPGSTLEVKCHSCNTFCYRTVDS